MIFSLLNRLVLPLALLLYRVSLRKSFMTFLRVGILLRLFKVKWSFDYELVLRRWQNHFVSLAVTYNCKVVTDFLSETLACLPIFD